MKKFFILMLFALNLAFVHQAMASSQIDKSISCYAEDGKKKGDKGKGEDEGATEEDCE